MIVGIKQILIVVMAVAVAGAAGFLGHAWYSGQLGSLFNLLGAGSTNAKDSAKGTVDPVHCLGKLEPEGEIIDVGAPTGSRIAKLAVHVGSLVKQDDPLAYLDSFEEMAAARDLAKAQLEEAEERYKAETSFADTTIQQADLHIRKAEEVAPLGIKGQEAEVSRAQAELEKAKKDQRRVEQLLDNQAIPRSQYDNVALIVQQAEDQLKGHKATLERLQKDQEISLLLARAELNAARAGKPRAQLATQRDSLRQALQLAEKRLERTIIQAPSPGEVLSITTRAGETARGAPILALGNTKTMFVVAEVYETDVRKVKLGQRVKVTSRAFPDDEALSGTVERIGKMIRRNDIKTIDPKADADTRVVEVRIKLDPNDLAARFNNMQVDVFIGGDGSGK